jgi:hypothetical protein
MPTDANLALQASVTKTATFNGAAVNLPGGTPRRGLKARVIYSAATNASGSNSVLFQIDVSPDNSTWFSAESAAADAAVALSTTAQSGEIFIPFETSQPYVRLTATVSGAGSTPTITYQGDIVLARP